MKTAHVATAARPAITSTVGALSDRELLRETRKPGPPRTAPARRHHRPPGRDRGARPVSAARLLQPVRLRGARARLQRRGRRSAHRRHAAVRRSTGRAGGVARRLADAERRRRVAVGVRPAAAPRVDLPRPRRSHRPGRQRQTPRRPYRPPPSRSRRRWCSMRWGGRSWRKPRRPPPRGGGRQERPAGPPDAGRPGPGTGAAGRPGAPARRRPLRAEGGHRRRLPTGSGAATGAALARGPAHDDRTARRAPRQGGARPSRPEPATAPSAQRQSARGREGNRPANSDVGAGATEQRSGGEARRASGDPRRRRYHTGASGSADTDLRAAAEHAGGDGPPSRYRGEADERRHSGVEVMRFGPRDFGGCQTTRVATRRRGGCSYVDPQTGRRCNSTHLIEIDHIVPHALGGAADPRNLRLLCGAPITATVTRRAGHRVSLHRDRCLPQGRASVGLTHTKPGRPANNDQRRLWRTIGCPTNLPRLPRKRQGNRGASTGCTSANATPSDTAGSATSATGASARSLPRDTRDLVDWDRVRGGCPCPKQR